MFQAPP